MEQSAELRDLTIRLYKAVETGDAATVERHLSRRPEALFIGTDPGEWWEGAEPFLQAMQAQAEAMGGQIQLVPGQVRAYREGSVGWAIDNGPTFRLPDGKEVTGRHTLVYHQEDGEWKLVHEHASFGVPNEAALGEDVTA